MTLTPCPKPEKPPKATRRPIRRSCVPVRRRARVRQRSNSETAKLVREADGLFSRLVRRPGRCRNCGEPATDAAHHISRRYAATRWNLDNASPLCRQCHQGFTVDPDLWERTWRGWVGFDTAARLTYRAIEGVRKTEAFMSLIVAGLKSFALEERTC